MFGCKSPYEQNHVHAQMCAAAFIKLSFSNAPAITPEVAGSSPVARGFESRRSRLSAALHRTASVVLLGTYQATSGSKWAARLSDIGNRKEAAKGQSSLPRLDMALGTGERCRSGVYPGNATSGVLITRRV